MLFPVSAVLLALPVGRVLASPVSSAAVPKPKSVNTTICNANTFTYTELAGYGKIPSDARDKYGDTIGGIGSAIALDKKSWQKKPGTREAYQGILYALPDRGWNTQGTQNTQSRIHKFAIEFDIVNATVEKPAKPNFKLKYLDTLLLTGPDRQPVTGLDPTGDFTFKGFPNLPLATYTGNGFGQDGPGGSRIALDTEGLVLNKDGTFFVSDEYAAYVYHFSANGTMLHAIRTPEAFIPTRNGRESFSAASPPIYASEDDPKISPENPTSGRANNQGLEALAASPDGQFLYTMLQSATMQDGGEKAKTRRYTRLLKYRTTGNAPPTLEAEYVVPLPILPSGRAAGQSEMAYISPTQFLVLSRDSGAGHGQDESQSIYRSVDIIDIAGATNVMGDMADIPMGTIANSSGVLHPHIAPVQYCEWLSFNVNSQLNRFGVRNGGKQGPELLNEKWESLALAPADVEFSPPVPYLGKEYYLISISDNDFITQNGYINSGKMKYKDASGFNLDTQVLVFKVRMPAYSDAW